MRHPPSDSGGGEESPLIAIVGPCASGKSSLARALRQRGYRVREIAQEHTAIPALWLRSARPDVLIYLHVSFEVACRRRRILEPKPQWWREQARRLEIAQRCADVVLDTDTLSREQVIDRALSALGDGPKR